LSQPRRRRRRKRKSGAPSDQSQTSEQKQKQQPPQQQGAGGSGRRRRRRGRARGESKRPSPKSSEDLVRALPKEPPATLTAPADGQSLEGIIGELQSQYGVPQYPQEYRITIKVADERDARPEAAPSEPRKKPAEQSTKDGPRREKAPAAPLLMRPDSSSPTPNKRRRRGRRGRRRRGGGGGEGGNGGAGPSGGNGSGGNGSGGDGGGGGGG
jgi:hypothetical protein